LAVRKGLIMPMLSTHAVVAGERITVQMYVHPHLYQDSHAVESIERDLKVRLALNVIEKLNIKIVAESDPRDGPAARGFTVWTTGEA